MMKNGLSEGSLNVAVVSSLRQTDAQPGIWAFFLRCPAELRVEFG